MDLVQGQDGGGRVVDRRRERFRGDVDHDAEREGRVLLQGAFLAHGDRPAEGLPAGRRLVRIDVEQGIPDGHVVADLRHQLDDRVRRRGQLDQAFPVERQQHAVPATADREGRLATGNARRLRRCGCRRPAEWPGVNALDDLPAPGRHDLQHPARPQRPAEVVDQIEKDPQARQTAVRRDVPGKKRDGRIDPDEGRQRQGETEHEKGQGPLRDRVPEHERDHARRQLGAGDLDRDEQGGADEDDGREQGRGHRRQERPRGFGVNGRSPAGVTLDRVQQPDGPDRRGSAQHGEDPNGIGGVAPQLVALKPGHDDRHLYCHSTS